MFGRPVSPAIELRLMIRPPPPGLGQVAADRAGEGGGASRLTRRTSSHSDSGVSTTGWWKGLIPALFDDAPRLPSSSAALSGRAHGVGVGDVAGHDRARARQLGRELLQGLPRAGHQHHAAPAATIPGRRRRRSPARPR